MNETFSTIEVPRNLARSLLPASCFLSFIRPLLASINTLPVRRFIAKTRIQIELRRPDSWNRPQGAEERRRDVIERRRHRHGLAQCSGWSWTQLILRQHGIQQRLIVIKQDRAVLQQGVLLTQQRTSHQLSAVDRDFPVIGLYETRRRGW